MKKVLVIIPTLNEVANIGLVIEGIERVASTLAAYSFRLLIVDDTSPDGTAQAMRKLQKQFGNIHLLSGKKSGLGRAYMRGFTYALKHEPFGICIMMDGDLSHNPEDIPLLLAAIARGADYVIGSRYASGGSIPGSWSLIRIINSRVANFVARKLVGITENVTDLTGGYKAMKRSALSTIELTDIHASGYIFQVSLLHVFIRKGFCIQEVPITFMSRRNGTSKLKFRDIIEFLYRAYKLSPDAPIQRFVRFGLVGVCGTVVNLGVLTLLVSIVHLNVLVAVLIAIEVSTLFNFFLNHFYTFHGYGPYNAPAQTESLTSLVRKMGIYNLGALGGAAISFTMFTFFYKVIDIQYVLADIIAILIAMSWNFFISTRYVWRAIDSEVDFGQD